MGRHAGFLTASSALLRQNNYDGPHLIYLPEFSFSYKSFLEDIKKPIINMVNVLLLFLKAYKTKTKN